MDDLENIVKYLYGKGCYVENLNCLIDNQISDDELDILIDAGYNLEIQGYIVDILELGNREMYAILSKAVLDIIRKYPDRVRITSKLKEIACVNIRINKNEVTMHMHDIRSLIPVDIDSLSEQEVTRQFIKSILTKHKDVHEKRYIKYRGTVIDMESIEYSI